MACTEAYKEHIMYTFNGFCKSVIRYAAINAWHDRSRRRQKEISLEYLTEEKFYPLGTTDEYFEAPYEEYPIMICGQTVILTNGELAATLLSLPEKNQEIIFLYFFGYYTQREIGEMYGRRRSTTGYQIRRLSVEGGREEIFTNSRLFGLPRKCSWSPPFASDCGQPPSGHTLCPCPRLVSLPGLPCVVLRHFSGRLQRLCCAVSGLLCCGGIPVGVGAFRRLWRRSVRLW